MEGLVLLWKGPPVLLSHIIRRISVFIDQGVAEQTTLFALLPTNVARTIIHCL